MSAYSKLDAHSRNCPSCIRQRDGGGGSAAAAAGKKHSLPCKKTQASSVAAASKIRRSASSLSYADIESTASCKEKENSFEGSTYLTPTQRKNNELKKLRSELSRARQTIHARDEEINTLRDELSKLKGDLLSPDSCEATSIPDSGNCEDQDSEQEPETGTGINNIDFELMETALREEEESRHQLAAENEELRFRVESLRQNTDSLRAGHEEQVEALSHQFNSQLERVKQENSRRLEELVKELADSSLRFSRQQDSLEANHCKVEEQSVQLQALRSQLIGLQGQLDAANRAKDGQDEQVRLMEKRLEKMTIDESETLQSKSEMIALQKQVIADSEELSQLRAKLNAKSQTGASYPWPRPGSLDASCQATPVNKDQQVQAESDLCPPILHLADDPTAAVERQQQSIAMTYQFLRRSIYYLLTDKDNRDYHLKSIQRLLNFTEGEREIIDQHQPPKKY